MIHYLFAPLLYTIPVMIELDFTKVKAAAMVLRAVKNRLRQKVLLLIDKNPGISVTRIYKELHLEQSVASQHLAILRQSGIVKTQREGKSIRYSADYESIKAVSALAGQLSVYFKS